jgi:MFS family permease
MFASAPGQSFLIAVFVDDMLEGTGLSRTIFSALYGLATVVSATVSVLLGRATDALGLRLAWFAVAAGLAVACLVASFAAGVVLAFAALALLRAFGQGSFPLLGTLVVNYWFGSRRGAAMAAASFGITAATIALPPLVALLVDGVGWRGAYRVLALVVAVAILPLGLLLRRPAGAAAADAALPVPDVPMPSAARRSRRLRIVVPRREAALLLAILSAPPLVMTALTFHAVSLLGERGQSAPAAAAALSLFGVSSAAAILTSGAIADRLSTRALLVATSTPLLVAAVALLASDVPAAAYAGFAAAGASGGLFGITSGIAWARTYGLAGLGRLQGVSFGAQIAAAAAGPLPLALSLQATGGYGAGVWFLAAVAAAALFAAAIWRPPAAT